MSESVWKRIEESRARHNVLEHPFYVRWSEGDLTADELARYSGQYRHATEALAKLCADTVELAPEAHRGEIELHAAEEQEHIGLWDDFVQAPAESAPSRPRTPRRAHLDRPRGLPVALARLWRSRA
jgi:pyrroloquinoline quinone (PQQ) biosynthesis protein C